MFERHFIFISCFVFVVQGFENLPVDLPQEILQALSGISTSYDGPTNACSPGKSYSDVPAVSSVEFRPRLPVRQVLPSSSSLYPSESYPSPYPVEGLSYSPLRRPVACPSRYPVDGLSCSPLRRPVACPSRYPVDGLSCSPIPSVACPSTYPVAPYSDIPRTTSVSQFGSGPAAQGLPLPYPTSATPCANSYQIAPYSDAPSAPNCELPKTAPIVAPLQLSPDIIDLPTAPAPSTQVLRNKCLCQKTVLKSQIYQREIHVPVLQRYRKKFYRPVVENIKYSGRPSCSSDSKAPKDSIKIDRDTVRRCEE